MSTRKRWLRSSLAAAVLIFVALCILSYRRSPAARDVSRHRLIAANLSFVNPRAWEATRALTLAEADILVLIEWTGSNVERSLLDRAGLSFVLDAPRKGTHGMAILTSKRVSAGAALAPSPQAGPCSMPLATVRITTKAGAYGVIGVHAPPPVRACGGQNQAWNAALARLFVDGRARGDIGAIREGDPVVILGDLNALPFSASLRPLWAAGFSDRLGGSFLALETTWSPFLRGPRLGRIDYALSGGGIAVGNVWTLAVPGSDHRAVGLDLTPPSPR